MRKTSLDMVHSLARRDGRVVFVGSDLGPATLDEMKSEMPQRFFMEGIAEQSLIGMAAGLAMEGFVPYVNTIATFLTRRCLEQVAIDVCLHNLPVRLLASGGGYVYAPLGPTHLAVEDIALMRALPGMTVVAVADATEMRRCMEQTLDWSGPLYIRFGKGGDPVVTREEWGFTIGRAYPIQDGRDVLLVSTGIMLGPVIAAAELLTKSGLSCGIVHVPTIKPLDTETLLPRACAARLVVTVEEHSILGGLGSAVLEALADTGTAVGPVLRLGIPDQWTHRYGSQESLLRQANLDTGGIVDSVMATFSRL